MILLPITLSYKMEPGESAVHQKMTKEAIKIWPLTPNEIKNHSTNSIDAPLDFNGAANFDNGDDIITGSGEEDRAIGTLVHAFGNHFWDADDPNTQSMLGNDDYNDGLGIMGSSYRRALDLWRTEVIPSYLRGDTNRSYYYLGRVAHLLEDAAQPSHVLLDAHGGFLRGGNSVLEDFTGNISIYSTYNGSLYNGFQYNYENLIDSFNWSQVQPTRSTDSLHPEFFRLFWYTAQKTQYWASEDSNGNQIYVDLNGNIGNWQCGSSNNLNLWRNESYSCSYFVNDSNNVDSTTVEKQANATIPHSMKAVAGLYRLFWDAVHIDWPTENHDYRRTGFTLLKGDLTDKTKIKSAMDFFMDASTGTEQVVKPSIADIDADGVMDIITLVHKTSNNNLTKMYGIEAKDPIFGKPKRKWTNPIIIQNGEDGAIYFPPTLANIDGDINKEIITGNRNGTVFVYDYSNGKITQKWNYTFESRFDGVNYRVKFNGGSAVADIDLDGDMEVIVADELDNDDSWPGKVYVLDGDDGTNQTSYIVGNGGAYASVSVANLDSDDYPEIVVPTQYGIKVLDYNKATNTLTEKCSNTHAYIWGSALIADVDYDNEYELVYVTASTPCAAGKTCTNNLYVINASSCTVEKSISLNDIPRPTPTVANLDSDSNMEIIVSLEQSIDGLGSIKAFDYSTSTEQWTYNASGTLHPGFVSPNIADIDNDGNYNIILGENDGSTVYILNHTGQLFFDYKVVGFMDNGLAIADLDNDGVAEIAFKRAASPETVFVSVSAINNPPEITKIRNVTSIAGDLINISHLISTSDAEGNGVSLLYSSPFNSSGQWQTTINDTGNYSILVEASDGNLSTTQFIDVIVFNGTNTKLQNQFTDGTTQKLLNFTQPGNLTVKVRLPKNATVIYSKLKVTGLAP